MWDAATGQYKEPLKSSRNMNVLSRQPWTRRQWWRHIMEALFSCFASQLLILLIELFILGSYAEIWTAVRCLYLGRFWNNAPASSPPGRDTGCRHMYINQFLCLFWRYIVLKDGWWSMTLRFVSIIFDNALRDYYYFASWWLIEFIVIPHNFCKSMENRKMEMLVWHMLFWPFASLLRINEKEFEETPFILLSGFNVIFFLRKQDPIIFWMHCSGCPSFN